MNTISDVKKNECTGCLACYNVCPKKAIEIIQDEKGFYFPQIDKKKCINCGICYKTCPSLNKKKYNEECSNIIAAWSKNEEERKKSTSGGISFLISKKFIENGGIVYGSIIDDNYKIIHKRIENDTDLEKMRGSKYVQSNIGDTFCMVKKDLKEGKKVLFTGTPCQISGLKSYLKKEYENIFLIDIICHGTPSPMIFEKYIHFIMDKYHEHGIIKQINFRYKKPNWEKFSMNIVFSDGFTYNQDMYHDYFLRSFLENYITRECCHSCIYTSLNRCGDITLADFWSYISNNYKYRNNNKGINLVLINNLKGEQLIKLIDNEIISIKKSKKDALRSNKCLYSPYSANKDEKDYWKKFKENEDIETFFSTFFKKEKKLSLKYKLINFYMNHAYLFIKPIQNKMNLIIDKKRNIEK